MRRILQLDLSLAPSKWYSMYPFKIPAILKLTHMVIVHPFHQGLSGCTLCNCSFFPDSRLDFCSYQSNLFTGFKTTGPSKFNISGFGFQYLYVKVTVTLQAVIKKLCLPRPFVKIYQTRLYIIRGRIKRRIS